MRKGKHCPKATVDSCVPSPGNVVLVAVALLVTIVLTPAVSGDRRAGSGGVECRRSGPSIAADCRRVGRGDAHGRAAGFRRAAHYVHTRTNTANRRAGASLGRGRAACRHPDTRRSARSGSGHAACLPPQPRPSSSRKSSWTAGRHSYQRRSTRPRIFLSSLLGRTDSRST